MLTKGYGSLQAICKVNPPNIYDTHFMARQSRNQKTPVTLPRLYLQFSRDEGPKLTCLYTLKALINNLITVWFLTSFLSLTSSVQKYVANDFCDIRSQCRFKTL